MAKGLKKASRPKAVVDPKGTPIRVAFGGRNKMGPERRFTTEAKARSAMVAELKSFVPWCERHNNEGIEAINDALMEVSKITFHIVPSRLECLFDKRYDMCLVITYWRTDA